VTHLVIDEPPPVSSSIPNKSPRIFSQQHIFGVVSLPPARASAHFN
jgi:hypothetical protein